MVGAKQRKKDKENIKRREEKRRKKSYCMNKIDKGKKSRNQEETKKERKAKRLRSWTQTKTRKYKEECKEWIRNAPQCERKEWVSEGRWTNARKKHLTWKHIKKVMNTCLNDSVCLPPRWSLASLSLVKLGCVSISLRLGDPWILQLLVFNKIRLG